MKKIMTWLVNKYCKCDYVVLRAGKNKDIYTVVPLKDVLYMELDDSRPSGINNPNVNVEMIVLERGELKTKVNRESFELYQTEYKKDSTDNFS
jgi:hypothetical protein